MIFTRYRQAAMLLLTVFGAGCSPPVTYPGLYPHGGGPPEPSPSIQARHPNPRDVDLLPKDAFSRIVSALISNGIQVESAVQDAGLITTRPVFIANIDHTNLGLGFRCGFAEGAGVVPLACIDFMVRYQILVQPQLTSRSTMTVDPSIVGLNASGRNMGSVISPDAIEIALAKLDRVLSPTLPAP